MAYYISVKYEAAIDIEVLSSDTNYYMFFCIT